MHFSRLLGIFAAAIALTSAVVAARRAPSPDEPLVVSTAWLASHLNDPSIVLIQVEHDDSYNEGHIPGARALSYMDIVASSGGLSSELPSADRIREAFEKLGVSDQSRVIAYASEGPMASRALFTLDYIGHERFAMLDGGLKQWRAEGRPVTREVPAVVRGHLTVQAQPERVATANWITAHLGKPGVSLIDTRTDGEYVGAGERHGMPSAGHIPGARQLQWEQLFRDGDSPLLKDRAELQRLYAARVNAGDTVATYCWVGYRASMTYFIARYLGYPVKLYDGSYQDWQARKLPVTAGAMP
jgi:thiosulfate/3-mercaptopyruvate sulfurtransferase